MNNHVLVLKGDVLTQFSKRFDLYIPLSWLGNSSIHDLSDNFLWLIFDFGTEKVIFARIFVRSVEVQKTRVTDGVVILGDPASSEYYYSLDSTSKINPPELPIYELSKVIQLNPEEKQQLEASVNLSLKYVFKVPTSILETERLALDPNSDNVRALAKLESRFRKTRLFQDIPVTHTHPKEWSPYLSLAVAVLEYASSGAESKIKEIAESIHSSNPKCFDYDFGCIDPDRLYPRTFTAPDKMSNFLEVLQKLQSAETRHQEMLKDLALIAASLSLKPEQSNNIDLLIETEGNIFIFEIKSSTVSNIRSQCRKAISQLVEYRYFMSVVTLKNVYPFLVIEDSGNSTLLDEYERIMSSVGVELFRYRGGVGWPHRCPGYVALLNKLGRVSLP